MKCAFAPHLPKPWLTGLKNNSARSTTDIQTTNHFPPFSPKAVLQTPPGPSSNSPQVSQNPSTSSPSKPKPNTPSEDEAWESLKQIIPFQTLRTIEKAGQYLGNEFGAYHKPWDAAKVRFCLAYPDLYSIGMSSTGHVILYSCLNDEPDLLCDRSYLPGATMQAALQTFDRQLFSVESHRPITDFHVVGMSISYELAATNCIKLMELAGIPYTWAKRDALARTFVEGPPLVFAGGITVTANPEPYADLFDFFSIGDGEDMLPDIGRCIAAALDQCPTITRHDLLLRLAQQVSGVYVPRFYAPCSDGAVRPVRPDVPPKIQKRNSLPEPWRATALVPISDPVHDRLTVEIRRGCTRGCRFCLPGMVQRPARDVAPEDVKKAVMKGVQETGYDEFSLLSLSCSDWLSLPAVGIQLKNDLKEMEESISLSIGSQRVDRFDEDIANVVGGLRQSGLTFAPEAGSQRMRDVVNKGLTNEDLARGVKLAYDSGYHSVKLYFMINLPTETDEDVMGIVETIAWLQRICRADGRRRLAVTVTISTFTPKSCTPFQWHSTSVDEVKRKQKMLKKELSKRKDVKYSMTDTMLSSMEDFIGRGDRRLSRVIIRAHELGAGMDAWWETMQEAYDAWCQAIRDAGMEWKYRRNENGEWNVAETKAEAIRGPRGWYDSIKKGNLDRKNLLPKDNASTMEDVDDNSSTSAESQSPLDRPLPWDHIDNGLSKGWLRDELMRALSENLTPDCAFNECSSCGVCGDDMGNNITIPPQPVPEYTGVFRPSSEKAQRFRVAFKKVGSIALASHLDIMRMFDRLLRKASIPMSFSGKFSPHARMISTAALPFGATADEEIIDFILRKEMDEADFRARFEEHLPQGLSLAYVNSIPVNSPNATSLMESAHYVLAIECDNETECAVDWNEVIQNVMSSGPVEIEKVNKKGKTSIRDLRKMTYEMRLATPDEAAPLLEHVGVSSWPTNAGVLFCNTELLNSGALGPDSIVDLINLVMKTKDFQLVHCHRRKIQLREIEISPSSTQTENVKDGEGVIAQ